MPVARKVVSDPRFDSSAARAPLDHEVGVLLPHGLAGERAGLPGRRLEQRRVRLSRDAGGGDVFIEVLLQIVVTRDLVFRATFFVQPDPAAASLRHARSSGKQPDQCQFFGFSAFLLFRLLGDFDAVEQCAGLARRSARASRLF